MRKITVIIMVIIMTFSMVACSDNGGETPDNNSLVSSQSDSDSSNESSSEAKADLSSPSVVVEFGDFDAIEKLGKDMQSFAVEENTVIKITGLYSCPGTTPSIVEEDSTGKTKLGISMYLEDGIEKPADGTKIEAVGVAVKGDYFMEFHVSADGFKVLE
ncbi:MAG: hypothetical protein MSH11_01800 [Ruminococcus sp.]|nr:hypothetical protein [Ruminococcus sp.]